MDLVTLKKKLSTYESDKGYLKNVSDDVLYEVIVAWENWTGPTKDFYRGLGFSHAQMAGVVGKAKKLKREGHFGSGEFKALKVDPGMLDAAAGNLAELCESRRARGEFNKIGPEACLE